MGRVFGHLQASFKTADAAFVCASSRAQGGALAAAVSKYKHKPLLKRNGQLRFEADPYLVPRRNDPLLGAICFRDKIWPCSGARVQRVFFPVPARCPMVSYGHAAKAAAGRKVCTAM
jgi:hypothetical protein